MHFPRRNCSALAIAIAGVSILRLMPSAFGQQNPNDTVVTMIHDDANSSIQSGLNLASLSGTTWWSPAINPTSGYAYVDTSYRIRTPSASSNLTFLGDSLTLISVNPASSLSAPTSGIDAINPANGDGVYAYFTLKGAGSSSVPTANTFFNDLVLANAGVVTNFANDSQTISGNIYLVPSATTLDGITTTVSGGIIDTHGNNQSGDYSDTNFNFTIASNITGPGMLRVENTGGGQYPGTTFVRQVIVLSGSNTFSGGLVLDGTSTSGTTSNGITGNGPDLCLNSPNALGTGTFTILPASYVGETLTAGAPGLAIDNTSGSSETLTGNNAQNWLGNFTFYGTNSLDMGAGPITLGANVTLNTAANTLSLEGKISGAYALAKTGAGTLLLNGTSTYAGPTSVTGGTLGGLGEIPGPLTVSSAAALAPGAATLGELTDTGALTLNPGSILDIELGSAISDEVLSLTGGVTLTGSVLDITLAPGYTPAVGTVFTIIDNQSSLPTVGAFGDDSGGYVTDALGDTYAVNYAAVADGDSVTNDVQLTFVSAVPEPTSLTLIGIAATGLLNRRRRK